MNEQILGNAVVFCRVALEALRSKAWREACQCMDGEKWPLLLRDDLRVIRAAEEELNYWPGTFNEAVMI